MLLAVLEQLEGIQRTKKLSIDFFFSSSKVYYEAQRETMKYARQYQNMNAK